MLYNSHSFSLVIQLMNHSKKRLWAKSRSSQTNYSRLMLTLLLWLPMLQDSHKDIDDEFDIEAEIERELEQETELQAPRSADVRIPIQLQLQVTSEIT